MTKFTALFTALSVVVTIVVVSNEALPAPKGAARSDMKTRLPPNPKGKSGITQIGFGAYVGGCLYCQNPK
jgi:hypothetical protein